MPVWTGGQRRMSPAAVPAPRSAPPVENPSNALGRSKNRVSWASHPLFDNRVPHGERNPTSQQKTPAPCGTGVTLPIHNNREPFLSGEYGQLAGNRRLTRDDRATADEPLKQIGMRWACAKHRFRAASGVKILQTRPKASRTSFGVARLMS